MRPDWSGEPPVLCLMGPTASGKTRVALALAARFPVEIVSVDSALVYRGMDIGTAKPSPLERRAAQHHLIDVVEPTEAYSAARFADDAGALVADIRARGCIPLLTGGTMLYFKALREGLSALPPADQDIRLVIDAMAAELGWPALHASLTALDPATGARLDPADAQRIQRALEVCWLTGRPMSELLAEGRRRPPPWRMLQISLEPSDRLELHRRIESRFEEMLELGLIGEVDRLRGEHPLHAGMPSMRCVGYRQVWEYLDGLYGLNNLRANAVAATRQLAKRQLTWLRTTPGVERFDCLAQDVEASVLDHVATTL
ncbi:MAG: tRNA (adenosine(37)-N6)-dimethylallyltransferase MiaA [Betaproteobacteria bacterium]|nr:tRNA (adenosine(37)-N6)-dimethylallyltransferase MiaA [Rhodocyclaceae bacterium]MCA3136012.1 tRNA (adenosine(37)-N6)-dimethylallyltransferase MiaA [Rhodocyclaceae bacterium]MCA3140986.1 tRNA (adenosine(37)-N6)-dimethylallyltransferase MiaA [Rhodocyclaceae bacterium]MCA3146218.1 tRNA (adenosine(37)-N6)-dimethylallyltransferase MiaA [Rhodocyclaceae bacterium]MCE2896983.1 tRNA (adenosine(37)-N6)-dimethylallyltransferase MiaA [Betaproteobacteria bacterium]